ncbi:presqualene diphosphate synthase HpnD [Terrihabitans sp. B22-R8]|uniref:presqualene diphosphate synthase HpnD n=1 Tax=Terrihabitans sp. B22-R8 TaxID=3425128 RepID=UPI00403C7C1E
MSALENSAPPPASGSSFYAAMRILPRARREAMFAVYGFCRAVDDIADEGGTEAEKRAGLQAWRRDIDALFEGADPKQAAFLVQAVQTYDLQREDFHSVIDGMEMDVGTPIVAPGRETLDLYIDRVACAVGRLSSPVFGLDAQESTSLSHHLGRALQITNILRDLDEDAAIGRLYLPREELEKTGMKPDLGDAATILAQPGLEQVCRVLAEEAALHFKEADAIMDGASRAAVRAPRLMSAAYRDVLSRLRAQGWAPPRSRVGVRKLRLLGALLMYGVV